MSDASMLERKMNSCGEKRRDKRKHRESQRSRRQGDRLVIVQRKDREKIKYKE